MILKHDPKNIWSWVLRKPWPFDFSNIPPTRRFHEALEEKEHRWGIIMGQKRLQKFLFTFSFKVNFSHWKSQIFWDEMGKSNKNIHHSNFFHRISLQKTVPISHKKCTLSKILPFLDRAYFHITQISFKIHISRFLTHFDITLSKKTNQPQCLDFYFSKPPSTYLGKPRTSIQ